MIRCERCKVAPATVTVYEPLAQDRSLCAACVYAEDKIAGEFGFMIEREKTDGQVN